MIRRLFRWYKLLLFVLSVVLVAWLALWAFADGSPEGSTSLRLLSFNVHGMRQTAMADMQGVILDGIGHVDPDILVMQECPMRNRLWPIKARLHSQGLVYHHEFPYHGDNLSGLAIFSRFPILETQEYELQPLSEGRSVGVATLDVDGRNLRICAVHFANSDIHAAGKRASLLSELVGVNLRTLQAASLLPVIEPWLEEPLILAGDFNTFPMSATWRMIRAHLLDAFPPTRWFKGTFELRGGIDVKIDHVFHTGHLSSPEARVLDLSGSDHKPVLVELLF